MDEHPTNIKIIRDKCVGCPVFEECRSWSVNDYYQMQYGVFAGYTGSQRRSARSAGVLPADWRPEHGKAIEKRKQKEKRPATPRRRTPTAMAPNDRQDPEHILRRIAMQSAVMQFTKNLLADTARVEALKQVEIEKRWFERNTREQMKKKRLEERRRAKEEWDKGKEAREAARIAARDVPECPDCRTKKYVDKKPPRANGQRAYIHLPCGRTYTAEEAAA